MIRRRALALLFVVLVPSLAEGQAQLTILDVPYISQTEALCGGAAAAMVLRFWGARGVDAESFAPLVDRHAGGIATPALVSDLQSRGWDARGLNGTDDVLAAEIARGRPVIALIEDRPRAFHYVVVVSVHDRVVIVHDPARAPFRVMARDEFARRWGQSGRWMAIVVPRASTSPTTGELGPSLNASVPVNATPCDRLIANGVAAAQANRLVDAERHLTQALSCPGAAAIRELAGVRLLQERWPEVEELSAAAVAQEPSDQYAWRLLATSRFIRNDSLGALDAWNAVREPRIDLIRIEGLRRTRQPVVERLIGVESQSVLTRGLLARSRHRLAELPSASSATIGYVPVAGALAELRARVVERPILPRNFVSLAAMGISAAATREVRIAVASPTGGGERLTLAWRFWPERERIGAEVDVPAPWGGVWGVQTFTEHQPFDRLMARAERTSAQLNASSWLSSGVRASVRAGLDRWADRGVRARAGGGGRWLSQGERIDARVDADGWSGPVAFALATVSVAARSSTARRGIVWQGRATSALASSDTPLDLWPGTDTGTVRPILLRAHPVIDNGALRVARLGRRVVGVSGEVQRWFATRLPLSVAAAAFVDSAATFERVDPGWRGDTDVGVGLRATLPGMPGQFRIDVAQGLRDSRRALSFVYEP